MSVTGSRQNTTAAAYAKSSTPKTMNDVPRRRESLCMRATSPSYVTASQRKIPHQRDPATRPTASAPSWMPAAATSTRASAPPSARVPLAVSRRSHGTASTRADPARPGEQPEQQEERQQADGHGAQPGDDPEALQRRQEQPHVQRRDDQREQVRGADQRDQGGHERPGEGGRERGHAGQRRVAAQRAARPGQQDPGRGEPDHRNTSAAPRPAPLPGNGRCVGPSTIPRRPSSRSSSTPTTPGTARRSHCRSAPRSGTRQRAQRGRRSNSTSAGGASSDEQEELERPAAHHPVGGDQVGGRAGTPARRRRPPPAPAAAPCRRSPAAAGRSAGPACRSVGSRPRSVPSTVTAGIPRRTNGACSPRPERRDQPEQLARQARQPHVVHALGPQRGLDRAHQAGRGQAGGVAGGPGSAPGRACRRR